MLLSLIGEQPIPVLLVDRALKPTRHILAHSERTRRVAENLAKLLPHAQPLPLEDPYDLEGIRAAFEQVYQPGMTFNLTGGTKPMAWAGYDLARARGAQVVYLESEKKQSRLYCFDFSHSPVRQTSDLLPRLITLDEYLQAHGLPPVPQKSPINPQEQALLEFLQELVDDLQHNLPYNAFEIDFLVQRGNQVAVIEAKSSWGKSQRKRDGLDQLTTITGREYLGTYTGRIWVVPRLPGKQLQDLAAAYNVQIVPISLEPTGPETWKLDSASQDNLRRALDTVLGPLPT